MITITNLKRQGLCLNKADGSGLHLPPRGSATVDDISGEMSRAARRGDISISTVAQHTPVQTETTVEVATQQRRKRS